MAVAARPNAPHTYSHTTTFAPAKASRSPLRAFIDGPIMMGSVGEGFSPLMWVLPQTYRVKREPSSPYDGMIFVPYAHPTEIWPRP